MPKKSTEALKPQPESKHVTASEATQAVNFFEQVLGNISNLPVTWAQVSAALTRLHTFIKNHPDTDAEHPST